MEQSRHASQYEGSPTERFFSALCDTDPRETLRLMREGNTRILIFGLLMRAGTLFRSQETCEQFAAIIEQSNVLQDPRHFQDPDSFQQDIHALRLSTQAHLERMIATAPPAGIISSKHSETLPA